MLQNMESCKSEALQIANVAKSIHEAIFKQEGYNFSGIFPSQCQQDCVPYNLKLLISMILYGPSLKSEEDVNSQACLTASQVILFNVKKSSGKNQLKHRHSLDREPPLPIYLGLNVHSLVKSKKLVDQLHDLCISISYDRVIQLEKLISHSMCQQFLKDGIVCPSHLLRGICVIGGLDNVDHNSSSSTAQGSFHGTGITITQFPKQYKQGESREVVIYEANPPTLCQDLPQSYATVPAVSLNALSTSVPERSCYESDGSSLLTAKAREDCWLKEVSELLEKELTKGQSIAWAAYHAKLQPEVPDFPVITAMLPLFYEKADSPAMIKHGMDIIKGITEFLNPGQIPVMTCDCPLFAKAKFIQWKWPTQYGEDKFLVMFGGLHIEMGLWNMVGDYLADSGWTASLVESGIATSGTADSFLTASHLLRTRHAHQVTLAALTVLQNQAFLVEDTNNNFNDWKESMAIQSPTFKFWDTIINLEKSILIFIRAHREANFDLYVETLEELVGYFFAFDHYNYARWLPIHIRDMKSLPPGFQDDFKRNWVASKSKSRSVCILHVRAMQLLCALQVLMHTTGPSA